MVSNTSYSAGCEGLRTVRSPTKLLSQFVSSVTVSKDAKALSFSEDNKPPKLSWGLRWGSCNAFGDIEETKSASQLSFVVLSGDLNWSVMKRGFAKFNGPLAGVARTGGCSRRPGTGLEDIGRQVFRNDPALEDFKASFHCCTLFTASSYSVGFFGTTESDLRALTIHGCFNNFRAETLRFGSF